MTIAMETQAGLAKRIMLARVNADLRQQDLAERVGVHRSAVAQWETGRTEPSASKMFAIARATNQPLDWFAEGLIADEVRPKGLEPLTFWLVADQAERAAVDAAFWSIVARCQVSPDTRRDDFEAVA